MLGYIRINKGELKVREYEIYSGYYCGICKSISKNYGQLPRMALSYDAAFLAILLASLDEQDDFPSQEHCAIHHIKKKTFVHNKAINYAADVMLILAWHKLQDDINDEHKSYAHFSSFILKSKYKKLNHKYPLLCETVKIHLKELNELENNKCNSIDQVAEAFSKIMQDIFREGIKTLYPQEIYDKNLNSIEQIGYHIGKWIYLIDAVDDIEENIETKTYNPLLYRFKFDNNNEDVASFRIRIEDDLRFNLFHYLAITNESVQSLDIKKNHGIINNIIFFGLNQKTEDIINRVETTKYNLLKRRNK